MKSYPKKIHPVSLAFVLLIALFVSTNALALGVLERVSVDSTGTEGDNSSNNPSTSNNGRYIAFESTASNLVAGDTNGNRDVFVHDRDTNTTTRVSVGPSGTEGNSDSYDPSISSDGRYVAFESEASNLVALDTNGELDIFVHDRITHTTTRVSVDSTGAEGDDESLDPSISGDGRYVAFVSSASNLVALDTNGADDIFVHNRDTNTTTRVSVGPSGTEGNSDSYDPPSPAMGAMLLLILVPAIWSQGIRMGRATSSSTTATRTPPPASRFIQTEQQKGITILTRHPSPAMGAMLLLYP